MTDQKRWKHLSAMLDFIEKLIDNTHDQDTIRLYETLKKRVNFKLGEGKL